MLADPDEVFTLVERGSPYYSVQRYVQNLDELRALSEAGQADADAEAHADTQVTQARPPASAQATRFMEPP